MVDFFFFKQKTAYEMRISDWSSDVCSSDLAKAIDEVQELLWEGALRIEEGGLAIAERDLREAQEALMEALERDAPDEEIERLMEELQQALNTFLDELVKQMQEQMAKRSEEHTSELQSLMRISYAVFCLKKKTTH